MIIFADKNFTNLQKKDFGHTDVLSKGSGIPPAEPLQDAAALKIRYIVSQLFADVRNFTEILHLPVF